MSEAAQGHDALVAALRKAATASDRVLDAFAAVPRGPFLPDVPLEQVYSDDAIVTHDEGGVPTSSSSQPSLMARMLERLDVRAGQRVLEVGTGTGYNAALLVALGAAVTSIELQPEVAAAAREHLRAAGLDVAGERTDASDGPAREDGAAANAGDSAVAAIEPGSVRVVTGDGAAPPLGAYDRIIVTAGCWSLPPALVDALADGGVLVAPLRINAVELVVGLRRDGRVLRASGGIPCGFMPLRGGDERPWRWRLGAGGMATSDADLGVEGRGVLDRLLATPGREVEDPLALSDREQPLAALLWLGLQGDPLISLVLPGPRPPWMVGLDVLPASLLLFEFDAGYDVAGTRLHGGDAALRTCREAMTVWRSTGSPGPGRLEMTIERHRDRSGWSLPFTSPDGAATMVRGTHRWTLRYPAAA